jgi:hypothetical protein
MISLGESGEVYVPLSLEKILRTLFDRWREELSGTWVGVSEQSVIFASERKQRKEVKTSIFASLVLIFQRGALNLEYDPILTSGSSVCTKETYLEVMRPENQQECQGNVA